MKNLLVSQKWDYKFNDFGTLKKHEKTRTELLGIARNEGENETALTDKPFNCAKCDEELANEGDITDHEQCQHEGGGKSPDKKTYSCSQCGKKFESKKDLSEHERIHSGTKKSNFQVLSWNISRGVMSKLAQIKQ